MFCYSNRGNLFCSIGIAKIILNRVLFLFGNFLELLIQYFSALLPTRTWNKKKCIFLVFYLFRDYRWNETVFGPFNDKFLLRKSVTFYLLQMLWLFIAVYVENEAGARFDNSFFDNCFVFLRQLKNRSFLYSRIRINRT